MSRKIIIFFCSLVLIIGFYLGFISYRNNVNTLFSKLSYQIKEEKFEDLYFESSESVKTALTEQQFVAKMKEAVSKMKIVDENLNFQRDEGWEKTTPADFPKEQGFRFTVQKLENENISGFVTVYWDDRGVFPKFRNITFNQSDDPNKKWLGESEFKGI